MIVRLTHAQGRAVLDRAGGLHGPILEGRRRPYGRKQHDYELPAIGWRTLLDKLEADAWGERGGQKRDRPKSFYTGLSRIQAAVAEREHHPALVHQGAMGVHTEVLPVFSNGRAYSPYPTGGHTEFVILHPRVHESHGHAITEWVPDGGTRDEYLMHPSDHWRFVMPSPAE